MKKHMMPIAAVVGGGLVVASIAFEYVRIKPDYRFIVEPWSVRGYQLTQGKVVAAIGVAIIVLSLLAASKRGGNVFNAGVAFGVWLAAVLIAQFPDPPPADISIPAFIGIVVTAVFGYLLARTVTTLVGDRIEPSSRKWVTLGSLVAIFLIAYLAFVQPTFVSPNRTEMDISVIVAIALGIILVAAVIAQPRELAVARMAMVSSLTAWVVIATLGGGARTNLIKRQIVETGASATYRDTQITSGLMIAFLGMIIVFIASVGIWARKRDRLLVLARARKQQEAAAASAAELAAS